MNFFTTSDNKAIETGTEFELGGGNFEPIPDNTQLKVIIEEAKWDNYDNEDYISLKWSVFDGEHSNRKIFQKLKVNEPDSKKSDKAKTMLAAIDANAGGQLMAAGVMPNDMSLALNLCNKPMAIVVAIWEIDGKSGKWVKGVSPLNKPAPAQAITQQKQTPETPSFDDIGF